MIDDTISRAAALDALGERPVVWTDKIYYILGARNQYDMDRLAIETVPSAQPGWISVTERLPDVKQRVLVQQKDGFMMVRKCIDGGHLAWFYSDIVAWMPLPKPWEGEQDERM